MYVASQEASKVASTLPLVPPPSVTISHPPKISTFMGETGRGEVSYEVWRYEVDRLLESTEYSHTVVRSAILRSLKGKASDVTLCVDPSASIQDLLAKIHSIYGTVQEKTSLVGNFYSAKQQSEESVRDWGCRVEELFAKAVSVGALSLGQDDTLCTVFWEGLRQELKDASSHKFDSVRSFDELRAAVRRIEESRKVTAKSAVSAKDDSQSSQRTTKLEGMVQQLAADLKSLRDYVTTQSRQDSTRGGYGGRGRDSSGSAESSFSDRVRQPESDFQCYCCGQYGHLQRGCRVILDHMRGRGLNHRGSARRGRW